MGAGLSRQIGDNIWNHNQVTNSKAIFAILWAVSWYIITITFPVPEQSSCITQNFFYNCERKDTYVASQGTAKQGYWILKEFRKLICMICAWGRTDTDIYLWFKCDRYISIHVILLWLIFTIFKYFRLQYRNPQCTCRMKIITYCNLASFLKHIYWNFKWMTELKPDAQPHEMF